jgi:hypothetical protein
MSLRLGVDLDGTLADLATAYRGVERALFGEPPPASAVADGDPDADAGDPEADAEAEAAAALAASRRHARRRDRVWQAIRETEDFWLGLKPIEPGVVARLHDLSLARGWEVFFITQRPATAGQSVQRQTQQWLAREGFDMPSVLTLAGARGRVAHSLELDALLDDHRKNCVDVLSESDARCRPILVLRRPSADDEAVARNLGIGVVRSVAEALALLDTPPDLPKPTAMQRIMERLGFGGR